MSSINVITVLLFFFLLLFVIFGIAIADYVILSLGFYKLATRRNIENPWLAWIPVANCWIMGALVEQYDMRRGQKRPWKMLLLILAIVSVAGAVIGELVSFFTSTFSTSLGMLSITSTNGIDSTAIFVMLGAFIPIMLVAIAVSLAEVAFTYSKIVCMFKIYESLVPEKAVKYIILYLLIPLAGAICLLKCKDKGYPYPKEPSASQESSSIYHQVLVSETEEP